MNPPKKLTCFAHRHLSFAEYGLWTHLREVSYGSAKKHTYRFDDRAIAGRFADERGCSKDSANRLRQSLVRKGFILWLEPQKRDASGHFAARLGRILSHEEWAERNPGQCIHDRLGYENPPVSNRAFHQSQVDGHQSHLDGHQSQVEPQPVSSRGTSQSQEHDIILIENTHTSNSYLSLMAGPEFLEMPKPSLSHSKNLQVDSSAGRAAETGEALPVELVRLVDESGRFDGAGDYTESELAIAVRLGLVLIDGEWQNGAGVKFDASSVAALLGRDTQ